MVQADTTRKKLRACTSNSSSVVLWNGDDIGAAPPSRWSDLRTNHVEGGAFGPRPAAMAMVTKLEGPQVDIKST
jgi:hypothetical protein